MLSSTNPKIYLSNPEGYCFRWPDINFKTLPDLQWFYYHELADERKLTSQCLAPEARKAEKSGFV